MRKVFQKIITVLFTLTSIIGFAQVYPVQMTPVFNVPYSSRISDYATSMDVKMQLLVNPSDITITNRQVRLKMYLQGNNLNAQSSDNIIGMNPIYINGGELLTLTNLELAPLFRLENLQGISSAQYANSLPEGMYSVCFEMYDFSTNQRISQKSCANLYLMLNDPPLLNTPARNESIVVSEFPNILFTWTPRQINATNVSYQFELKEILDPTIDPQIGFLTSPVLYQEELYSTALLYDLSKPNLLPGKRYAWRVKAVSTSGLSQNNVFKNDGYSEIYHFTYASNCPAPAYILSEALSARSVKISWLGNDNHTKYHVQYRKANVAGAEWFEVYTMNTQTTISDLEAGITYEFRVGGSCEPAVLGNTTSFTYSGINQFSMPAAGTSNSTFTCGLGPTVAIANQTPITNLIVSETFTAGDFPVKILELTDANPNPDSNNFIHSGKYSGKGYIIVPYLADTKIAVIFNNITVNTNYQLINGIVETSYNPDWNNVSDLEDLTNNGEVTITTVPFVITNITINPNGDIIVSGANGQQITIPGGGNVQIVDSAGNIYTVDENGNMAGPFQQAPGGAPTPANTDGVASNGQATAITAEGVLVTFEKASDNVYGFDSVASNADSKIKALYKNLGSSYFLPYKSILNTTDGGTEDYIIANIDISDSKIVSDSIIFKTEKGIKIESQKLSTNEYKLKLKGNYKNTEEEILATIKQGDKYKVAGAFKLLYLAKRTTAKVILVNTDNATIPNKVTLQNYLNTVYKGAGASFEVLETLDINIDDKLYDTSKIDSGESGFAANYTSEQQAINSAIRATAVYNANKDAYYLILTNKKPSKADEKGFMPLGRQFGYIFSSGNHTIAHELGHGIFQLKHPFSSTGYNVPQGSTSWLMDYTSTDDLPYVHWKQIQSPTWRIGVFDSDEEGEYKPWTSLQGDLLESIPSHENSDNGFVSVTGKIIVLPKTARDFTFLKGYLIAFTIGNDRWISLVEKNDKKTFKGFFKDAIQTDTGYNVTNKNPYTNNSTSANVFYAVNNLQQDCSNLDVYIGSFLNETLSNNGGVGDNSIYDLLDISLLNEISNKTKIATVSNKINCLKGRAKEFYKFVEEHFQSNNISLSQTEKDNLITSISQYKNVFINKLDGDANQIDYKVVINFREMLNYGHLDLIAKLNNVSESNINEVTLVINLEDYERIRDEYLLYKNLFEEIDTDCTIGDNLRRKFQKDGNEIKFDFDFFKALAKDSYEIISGNEAIELLSCLLTNLKIPESYYNPNRIDNAQNKVFEYLFEKANVDPENLAALLPRELYNYTNACGCGIWNSIVDLALGITTLADGLTTNPEDFNTFLNQTYNSLSNDGAFSSIIDDLWITVKEHHGYVDGYGLDQYQTTYATCYDVVFVLSFYVGVGELKALSTAGELSDVAKIVANVIKSVPTKTAATIQSLKNIVPIIGKFSSNIARKTVLAIIEKVPDDLLKVLPDGAKIRIVNAQLTQSILEFSNEGLKILQPIGSGTGQINHIIYESSEVITDMVSGKTGILKIGRDDTGKIVAWIFSSNTEVGILARIENLGYNTLANEIKILTPELKSKFLSDFEIATSSVLKSLNDDIELLNVWKKWNDKGIKSIDDLVAFKKVWKQKIRDVSFDDFYTKTSYQIGKANGNKFAPEIYEAWIKGKGHEAELKTVYRKFGLDPAKEYPPCEGVWGVDEIKAPTINDVFDRFQTRDGLGGGYAGVVPSGSSYTISSRALMENYSELVAQGKDYYYYKFKFKEIPSGLKFEYGEAIPWFDELGGATQVKSSNSFQNLSSEIEVIEKWKMTGGVWTQVFSFKSIDELLIQFNSIIGNKGLKHLFRGEINSSGVASGVHHISAVRAGTARIVPSSIETIADGFYKASVEILDNSGNWISKTEKSTFFPDAWDEIRVMQEIQSAANNRVGNFIENTSSYQKYFGTSTSGQRIYIVRTPPYNNNIFTAWFEPL